MRLKQTPTKNGRVYLSITHNYRDGKKTRTKSIRSLGYLDELKKEYPDPVAYFTEVAAEMERERKAEVAPIALSFSPLKKVDMRSGKNQLELGYSVLSYYYHLIALDRFWANRRMRNDAKYNPDAIFKLNVYERILRPGSKAGAFANKERYLDRMDFSYDDMMRALTFFAPYREDVIAWINKHIAQTKNRNTSRSYYDVTNYYFEIDAEDELRKKGVSKEKRRSPIVQMGLLMDTEGIPLSYQLYPGNTNDCLTLLPVLKEAKARYGLGRTIVVADKGLCTSDNIAACVLDGNGYVFSQSVRKGDAQLKAWVLDEGGYSGNEAFKIKSRHSDRAVYVTGTDGKVQKVDVPVKCVAFWSKDYDLRAKHERECVLQKSARMVTDAGAYEHAKSSGAGRYVKARTVDAGTGEIKCVVREIDEAKIGEDERYDGYYCIITSEADLPDEEIIDIYRGLWRIEETFKVTKSDLESRPVFVSRKDHIEAHFLTCYVALVLLRLIQADTGFRHSAAKIAEAIRGVTGTHMKENCYLFGYRTKLTDELGALIGQELNRQIYTVKAMRDILAETKKAGR